VDLAGIAALVVAVVGIPTALATFLNARGRRARLRHDAETLKLLPEGSDVHTSLLRLLDRQIDDLHEAEDDRGSKETLTRGIAILWATSLASLVFKLVDLPQPVVKLVRAVMVVAFVTGCALGVIGLAGLALVLIQRIRRMRRPQDRVRQLEDRFEDRDA